MKEEREEWKTSAQVTPLMGNSMNRKVCSLPQHNAGP